MFFSYQRTGHDMFGKILMFRIKKTITEAFENEQLNDRFKILKDPNPGKVEINSEIL